MYLVGVVFELVQLCAGGGPHADGEVGHGRQDVSVAVVPTDHRHLEHSPDWTPFRFAKRGFGFWHRSNFRQPVYRVISDRRGPSRRIKLDL